MGLINDTSTPFDLTKLQDVCDQAFVRGDQDVKLEDVLDPLPLVVLVVHLVLGQHVAAGLTSVIHDDVHVRPQLEFPLPIGNGGEGGDHQKGAVDAVLKDAVQVGQALDGLAQPHFVGQEAVAPVEPGEE